jgi:hypothetical protein
MESHVITVDEKAIAEAIAKGLTFYFNCEPLVREAGDGWGVFVSGIVPENARLLMNHYALGIADVKAGRV